MSSSHESRVCRARAPLIQLYSILKCLRSVSVPIAERWVLYECVGRWSTHFRRSSFKLIVAFKFYVEEMPFFFVVSIFSLFFQSISSVCTHCHRKIATYGDHDKWKQRRGIRMAGYRLNQRVNETKICEIVKCRTQEIYLNLHICCRCRFFLRLRILTGYFHAILYYIIFSPEFLPSIWCTVPWCTPEDGISCVCLLSCLWNRINIHSHLDGCRVVFGADGMGARHDSHPSYGEVFHIFDAFSFFTRRTIVGNESLTTQMTRMENTKTKQVSQVTHTNAVRWSPTSKETDIHLSELSTDTRTGFMPGNEVSVGLKALRQSRQTGNHIKHNWILIKHFHEKTKQNIEYQC